MNTTKKQIFLLFLVISLILVFAGIGSAVEFGFNQSSLLRSTSASDAIWNSGTHAYSPARRTTFMTQFLSTTPSLQYLKAYLHISHYYSGSDNFKAGETFGAFYAGYLYVTKPISSANIRYESRGTLAGKNEEWRTTISYLIYDLPLTGSTSDITPSTTPKAYCTPNDYVADKGGNDNSGCIGGDIFSCKDKSCSVYLQPGMYYVIVGIGGYMPNTDTNKNTIEVGGSMAGFNEEKTYNYANSLNRIASAGYAITTSPMTTSEIKQYFTENMDTEEFFCEEANFDYYTGYTQDNNKCCGDDGDNDLNYQIEDFTCLHTNNGWKWSGIETRCDALSGDYKDELRISASANNGSDGCCGDDTNCVLKTGARCADYDGIESYCTTAGCEWTPGEYSCVGEINGGVYTDIDCSVFYDYNKHGCSDNAPIECTTENANCVGTLSTFDCSDYTKDNCPPNLCNKIRAPGTCSGDIRGNICAGLDDTTCDDSSFCDLTTTPTGTDNAYVSSGIPQYLCNKDGNGETVVYDNSGSWKWWSAWTNMYTIHEYDDEFYISNGGSWYTCNANNHAQKVELGDFVEYYDPRWTALNITEDPSGGLCPKVPPNLKLLTGKTSADNNPFNYLIAAQADGCNHYDSVTNSYYPNNENYAGCCYSTTGNTHDYNASFFLETDCSNLRCFYQGESLSALYNIPWTGEAPSTTFPNKYSLTYHDSPLNGACEDIALYDGSIGTDCTTNEYCAGDDSSLVLGTHCCLNGVCVENKTTDATSTTTVTGDYTCIDDLGGEIIPDEYHCSADLVISSDSNGEALCCLGTALPPVFTSTFSNADILGSRYLCYQHPIPSYGSVFGECCGDGVCNNLMTLSENALGENNGLVFATGIQANSVLNYDREENGLLSDAVYNSTIHTDYSNETLEIYYYKPGVNWTGTLRFSLRYTGKNVPVALEFYNHNKFLNSYFLNESALLPPYNYFENEPGVLLPNVWHRITLNNINVTNFTGLKIKFSENSFSQFASTNMMIDDFVLTNDRTEALSEAIYCSELGNWTTTMSEDICKAQLGAAWTGSACCGEKKETYNDSNAMGCFKGIPVRTNQITPLAAGGNVEYYPEILYYQSQFYNCTTKPKQYDDNSIFEVGPFSMIGDWYCDTTSSDNQARWLPLSSIDAEQILASKLYGMRTEDDYDLHCDNFTTLFSSVNTPANIQGKAIAQAKTACVLKNYDTEGATSTATSTITIGLSLNNGDNVNDVVNTILEGNYPFNGTNIYGTFAVDCSGSVSQQVIITSDNPKLFNTCSVEITKPNNNIDVILNVSYSAPLKLLTISMNSAKDKALLTQFFTSIADFFRGLFQATGTASTQEINELTTLPISFGLASFEHLYLSERGDLSIIGTMEKTADNWYARVDYYNFTGSIKPLVDSYNQSLGGEGVFFESNNKSEIYVNQSITIQSPTSFDWRYLTSNIRLQALANN